MKINGYTNHKIQNKTDVNIVDSRKNCQQIVDANKSNIAVKYANRKIGDFMEVSAQNNFNNKNNSLHSKLNKILSLAQLDLPIQEIHAL